jgi:hypothetical protein
MQLPDFLKCAKTEQDGMYELSVAEHKTSLTGGPLTVYLDQNVSLAPSDKIYLLQ